MIDIQFNYKEKKTKINCNRVEHTIDVCQKFATEAKLKYDNLLFFFEGAKINLELDLVIEDQFNLNEKPKKKVKILVFDDVSQEDYFAKFNYNTREELIKCSKNEKINQIIDKFALKAKVKKDKILLLYKGEMITEDDFNKTYEQLASAADKQSKVMNILVNDYDNRDSVSSKSSKSLDKADSLELSDNLIDDNNPDINPSSVPIPAPPINPIDLATKKYYLKFFIILIVQYGLISFLAWLGFFLEFNNIITKSNNVMKWTFITALSITIISSFVYIDFLKQYKTEPFLYGFNALCGLFIIVNCFLLSKYVDQYNILCTLLVILIEIIAMELYAFLFNSFKLYLFGLISFILSMISIVGAYFWIKNITAIIIIYSIGIAFILYSVFIIFLSLDICKRDEYIYASLIHNFSIFFGLSLIVLNIISSITKYLKNLKQNYSYVYFYIRIFFFFIIQYIIIIYCIWIGFYSEYNEFFISSSKTMIWTFIPSLLILLGMCAAFCGFFKEETSSYAWYVYHALYVPYIIIFSFLFSSFIEQKIILCLLFIHLIDLIAILIYLLLFKSENLFGIFFSPFFASIISVILFHFLWIKDDKAAFYISLTALLNIIYLTVFSFYAKDLLDSNEYNYGVILFNYAIFCLVFAVTLGLVMLGLYLAFLVLHCICVCCFGENS